MVHGDVHGWYMDLSPYLRCTFVKSINTFIPPRHLIVSKVFPCHS